MFLPHWSKIIPGEIITNLPCVIFHMTDVPYGRGGSPLQNLIKQGHSNTKISAIKAVEEIDAGPVYAKRPLDLSGTALEIFLRSVPIIESLIVEIIEDDLLPFDQKGEVVLFKRRSPKQSVISGITDCKSLYDHIRMLDCPGYPKAFLETDNFILEFDNAKFIDGNNISANVRFIKK